MKKILYILFFITSIATAQVRQSDAFYGAGAYATGGSGGTVLHVTNLSGGTGTGSFRWALNQTGARYIVFDVSGVIDFGGAQVTITGRDNLTVLGQTAPLGGITIQNGNLNFWEMDNVIVRYIRFRNGEVDGSGNAVEQDAFTYWGGDDIMFDHISATFGGDESITFTNTNTDIIENVTFQRSLIGSSKTGGIMGNASRTTTVGPMSYLFNLNVDNGHRTPNLAGNARFDVINNVVFNWNGRGSSINGNTLINQIGNYYKKGTAANSWPLNDRKHKRQSGSNQIYARYNFFSDIYDGTELGNQESMWAAFSGSAPISSGYFTSTQHTLLGEPFTIMSANEAYIDVIGNSGANAYLDDDGYPQTYQDSYDATRSANVLTTTSIGDKLPPWTYPTLPTNTRGGGFDTDNDGMADAWEIREFGNLSKTATGRDLDSDRDNIMVYANQVDGVVIVDEDDVTGVSVTPESVNVADGDSGTLVRTIEPDTALDQTGTWSSSNPDYVTVDSSGNYSIINPPVELITDGDMSSNTNWIEYGESSISGGEAHIYSPTNLFSYIQQNDVIEVGKTYELRYTVTEKVGGALSSDNQDIINSLTSSLGENYVKFKATTGNTFLMIKRYGVTDMYLDDVSLKEVPTITYTTNDGGFTDSTEFFIAPTEEVTPTPYDIPHSQRTKKKLIKTGF